MQRNTQQRQAILKVFEKARRPFNVNEILELAQRECPNLGIATVYRTVKALIEEERLVLVELPGGIVCYELPSKRHHHHFSCTECQKVFDLEICGINVQKLVPAGFRLDGHEIVLFGSCSGCA